MRLESFPGPIIAYALNVAMTIVAGFARRRDNRNLLLHNLLVFFGALENGGIEDPIDNRLGEAPIPLGDVGAYAVVLGGVARTCALKINSGDGPATLNYAQGFAWFGFSATGVVECQIEELGLVWVDVTKMNESCERHCGPVTRSKSRE